MQAGTPIVRVQNVTELRVHINVPESVIGLVSNPDMFRIEAVFPDRPDEPLPADLSRTRDRARRRYRPDLRGDARPRRALSTARSCRGMTVSVRVSLAAARAQEMMTLPVSAIDTDPGGDFRIWIYDPDTERVAPREGRARQCGRGSYRRA